MWKKWNWNWVRLQICFANLQLFTSIKVRCQSQHQNRKYIPSILILCWKPTRLETFRWLVAWIDWTWIRLDFPSRLLRRKIEVTELAVTPFRKWHGFDLDSPFCLLENKLEKHQPTSSQKVSTYTGMESMDQRPPIDANWGLKNGKYFVFIKKVHFLA